MSNIALDNLNSIKDPKESPPFFPDFNHSLDDDRGTPKSERLRLLVVDQNTQVRKACCEIAESSRFIATEAESIEVARKLLKQEEIAIVLLDVTHSENGSLSLLEEMKALYPDTPTIVMSARASIDAAVDMMRAGAFDYLSKPFPLNVLTEALERAVKRWHFGMERRQLQEALRPGAEIIDSLGKSIEMEKLYRILSNVTDSTHPVMILGEKGTGKTLVAHSIHSNGPQSAKSFVSLDCTSLGPDLLERTLFGDPKRLPEATKVQKYGLLASTEVGTIFLDEIGDLPPELQGQLIRVLRDKEIFLTGRSRVVRISTRILAATSRDLVQMVKEGLFRMDLYRLLSVVNLRIPPLRGRPDDIAFLTKRFLEKIQRQTGLTRTLSPETLQMLETYDWPDNVQELEDTLARACSQSAGPALEPIHLPQKLLRFHRNAKADPGTDFTQNVDLYNPSNTQKVLSIAQLEQHAIMDAMRETNGDKLKAAELLGIGKTTLYRKLKEYGLFKKSDSAVPLESSITNATDARSVCA